jgi:uncharacterized membrane protein YraQ (UPF0718 family)
MFALYLYGIWDNIENVFTVIIMALFLGGVVHIGVTIGLLEESSKGPGTESFGNQLKINVIPLVRRYILMIISALIINMLIPDKKFFAAIVLAEPSAEFFKSIMESEKTKDIETIVDNYIKYAKQESERLVEKEPAK